MVKVFLGAVVALAILVSPTAPILARNFEEILERVRPSVYLVIVRTANGYEEPRGTAWVVAPGKLATNAHVALSLPITGIDQGVKAYVRSNTPPYKSFEIEHWAFHPHYFGVERAIKTRKPAAGGAFVQFVPAYDVAILSVDPAARLGSPLRIATATSLYGLAPGQPIAFLGYPSEGILGGPALQAPNPQSQVGRITSVTDPFNVSSAPTRRVLIHHNLPATGGASGSPIFNESEEVIGVLSAGNVIQTPTGRAPSAVQLNFAQRADIVTEALRYDTSGQCPPDRDSEWLDGLNVYEYAYDHFPRYFFAQYGVSRSEPYTTVLVRLARTDSRLYKGRTSFRIPRAGHVLIIAYMLTIEDMLKPPMFGCDYNSIYDRDYKPPPMFWFDVLDESGKTLGLDKVVGSDEVIWQFNVSAPGQITISASESVIFSNPAPDNMESLFVQVYFVPEPQ